MVGNRRSKPRASCSRAAKVREVMREWKSGGLRSGGSGRRVGKKQALAIALAEAGVMKSKKARRKKRA
jgi:hypothetical protein